MCGRAFGKAIPLIDLQQRMWEQASCEVCGGTSAKSLICIRDYHQRGGSPYAATTFRIMACPDCSHVYVADRLARAELADVYRSGQYRVFPLYQDPASLGRLEKVGRVFVEDIVSRIPFKPGMQLLEVGSSFGHLLRAAKEAGFVVQGIEPSEGASDASRQAFDLQVSQTTIEDAVLVSGSIDIIVAISVLEHVFDLETSICELAQALRDDGSLYVEVPCYDSIPVRLYGPRAIARQVRQKKGIFHPVEHVRYFTSESMRRWLGRHFRDVCALPDPRWGRVYGRSLFSRTMSRVLGASPTGNIVFLARRPLR